MVDRDVFYQVILDGLARYLECPFIDDALRAIMRFPEADFYLALNKNQVASKKWLIDELHRATGGGLGTVYILGGWYGVLAAMLLHDERFDIASVISCDIDPSCAPIADCLNQRHAEAGRFTAVTADIGAINYAAGSLGANGANGANGGNRATGAPPDVVINTICEHLAPDSAWDRGIPTGTIQILQSNDQFDCDEHVNCVADLDALKRQAPMSELFYAGQLRRKRYTRFMLIGRK